jgi:hypothetical protein
MTPLKTEGAVRRSRVSAIKGGFMNRKVLAVLALLVAMCTSAFAQTSTTGAVVGRVTDGSGPLPGVTVELRSPALIGTRMEVTDSNGEFRFSSLAPGTYTVTANLSGFGPLEQNNLNVGLGRTATLDLVMRPTSVAETITVTAAAPVVDVTSAASGANVTAETMEALPLQRDFYAVAQVAPGANTDAAGTTFYGSTGAENQYVIDGLNTTGVELGTEAKTLNFDFIQEVQVLTGGLPAEYGRLTGGVINAITKSGGNDFTGDVFGFGQGGSLLSENSTGGQRPDWTTTVTDTDSQSDYGFDLGGYVVRDRLWFFGAYNRINETENRTITRNTDAATGIPIPGAPSVGSVIPSDITRDVFAGKLTLRLTDQQQLAFSIFGDPSDTDGVQFNIAGPESTYLGNRATGGNDMVLRYNGTFASNFLLNGLVGRHHEEDYTTGPGATITQFIDQTQTPNAISGGFGFFQNQEFDRDTAKLDVSAFFGRHELKVGADREQLSAYNENWNGGGGQRIYTICAEPDLRAGRTQGYRSGCGRDNNTANDILIYRHRYYVPPATFDANNTATWTLLPGLVTEAETNNTAFYVQDSWRVMSNVTLNAGLRLEQQEIVGQSGEGITIDDNLAPRLGAIWDIRNNGRSKLYANYGRFYESVPMDINTRAFGGEVQVSLFNYSKDPNNLIATPICAINTFGAAVANCIPRTISDPTAFAANPNNGTAAVQRNAPLGGTTPVDPDLKGQYIDEYLIGYEQEVANGLSLGVKGTYRNLGRVIEDFLVISEGNYFVANPGEGIGKNLTMFDYTEVKAPKAKREFLGVELSARGRFRANTQFFASYLWSRLEGNYDGVFQASTGQLDPNINSAFDYGDFLVNADGPLSSDRTHQAKVYAAYTVPSGMVSGLNLGVSAHYSSGTPLTAYGYSSGYQNWEYFLTERGALGRGPADYEADFHVGYPLKFGNGLSANFLVDVFNVLNRQGATALDQRFNLVSDGGCAGVEDAGGHDLCNGDGGVLNLEGTINPMGQVNTDNAPNPDFLNRAITFTAPRAIRLGVRLSF